MTNKSLNMQNSNEVGMKVVLPLVQTVFMPRNAQGVQEISDIKTVVYMESLRNFGEETWLQGYYEIDVLYIGLNGKNCRHRVMLPLKEQVQLPKENLQASDFYYNIVEPHLEILAPLVLEFTGRLQAEILPNMEKNVNGKEAENEVVDVKEIGIMPVKATDIPDVPVQTTVIDVEALRKKTLDNLRRENAMDSMFKVPKILIAKPEIKVDDKMDLQLPEIFEDKNVDDMPAYDEISLIENVENIDGKCIDMQMMPIVNNNAKMPELVSKSLVENIDVEAEDLVSENVVANLVEDVADKIDIDDTCGFCEDVQEIVTDVVEAVEQISNNVDIVGEKFVKSMDVVVDTAKNTVENIVEVVNDVVDCVEEALSKEQNDIEVNVINDNALNMENYADVSLEGTDELIGETADCVAEILPAVGMRTHIGMQESRAVNMFAAPQKSSYRLKFYVVQAGDEPLAIALKHNVSLDNLLAKNRLSDGVLEAGKVLRIPS